MLSKATSFALHLVLIASATFWQVSTCSRARTGMWLSEGPVSEVSSGGVKVIDFCDEFDFQRGVGRSCCCCTFRGDELNGACSNSKEECKGVICLHSSPN